MGDTSEQRYEIPGHVLARSVGNDTVLLDLKQEEYFSLDRVGTEIWAGLQAADPVVTIVERIATDHGVDVATVAGDVATLLDELVRSGLLVCHDAAA